MVQTAQGLYKKLERERQSYVDRAREVAALTIPHLFPDDDNNIQIGVDSLPEPYHSIGARAVNNLASKIVLALFPPSDRFFRLAADEAKLSAAEEVGESRKEIEETLSDIEDVVLDEIESPSVGDGPLPSMRTQFYPIAQQLIVAGNCLHHIPATAAPRWYRLDCYVVDRDPRGNIKHIVVRERVAREVLDKKIQAAAALGESTMGSRDEEYVEVYKWIRRAKDHWVEVLQINDRTIGGQTRHELHRLPYLPLTMNRMSGESYGTGQGTDYMPDFRTINALEKDLIEFAAISARMVGLVDPAGTTELKDLNDAPNGALVPGREQDVHILQANKLADFQVIRAERVDIEKRIGLAFLLNSTVPRDAERVTAEEIRLIASELEDTQGGFYGRMTGEWQLPMVTILLGNLQDRGTIPELPDSVKPRIVTGLEAISRGHEFARMREFVAILVELFGPQALGVINQSEFAESARIMLGIKNDKLIRTEEEILQQQQAEQGAAIAEKVSPEMMKQIGPQIAQAFSEGAA